jgi:ABC-type branched-subunit amino acid transport system substrate-binding protein
MSNTAKLISGFIVLALVVVVVLAGDDQPTSQKTIPIGSIAGLTGEYSEVGNNWSNGISLAKKQFEKDNPNLKINIIEEDSGFDTSGGVSAYKRLTEVKNIDALLNMGTPTMDGIFDSVKNAPYPVIHGFEQSSQAQDDSVFQMSPSNIPAERALGEYARKQGYESIVLFHTDSPTYINFAEAVEKGFGGPVDMYALSPDEQNDFRTEVTKALNTDPDATVLVTTPQQGATIVNEMFSQTDQAPPVLHDANFFTGFSDYKRLVGNSFEKLSDDVFTLLKTSTRDDFVKAYENEFGRKPGVAADLGYDAFTLLMKNYDPDGQNWIQNVKNANFAGASGRVKFNEVGMRGASFEIVTLGDDLEL